MSATNHTTNYELPIFIGTDKPAWLVDWNGAMTAIDTALHQVEGKADQAGTDIGGIESSISTINSTLTSINNAVSQLRVDTNANTGSINTITSLIGNGEPTTTDKTIIGAINEINGEIYNFNLQAVSGVTVASNANITINSDITDINALLNSDKSVGKIYGSVFGTATGGVSPNTALFTITIPGLNTETAYDVKGYELTRLTGSSAIPTVAYLHFNVGNTVEVRSLNAVSTDDVVWSNLCPCLLFLKDLGD